MSLTGRHQADISPHLSLTSITSHVLEIPPPPGCNGVILAIDLSVEFVSSYLAPHGYSSIGHYGVFTGQLGRSGMRWPHTFNMTVSISIHVVGLYVCEMEYSWKHAAYSLANVNSQQRNSP